VGIFTEKVMGFGLKMLSGN